MPHRPFWPTFPFSITASDTLLAGIVLLLVTSTTRAGFMSLTVQESGGAPIVIEDNNVLDADLSPGIITVNTTALNLVLTQFQFITLGGASNAESGTPLSGDPASLTHTGEVTRLGRTGVATLSITSTDNDFLFPAGSPKFMASAASDTFSFTSAGDSRTFQSFFDPGNAPGAMVIPSPLLAFLPPAGTGPFATAGAAPLTTLGVQPIPFSLTNTSIITLAPPAFGQSTRDQFTAATIVLPEPAIFGLLALGAAGLVRRRPR